MRRKAEYLPLLAAAVLCAAASANLIRMPWFDEVLTLDWLTFPLSQIPFEYKIPNNHIVYTLCLAVWQKIFGSSVPVLRMLSLLFGAATLLILWKPGKRYGGIPAAGILLLLLAGSGPMQLFSTAIRGYALGLMLAVLSFVTAGRWLKKGGWKNFLLNFLVNFLAVGTMPTNVFVLGFNLLFHLPGQWKEKWMRFIFAGLSVPVALLLFYRHIWEQFRNASKLAEGWGSITGTWFNLYTALLVIFLPCAPYLIRGVVRLAKKNGLRLIVFGVILTAPVATAFLFKAPPFPRIFYSFFGLWTLIFAVLLRAGLPGFGKKFLLPAAVVWILIMRFCLPDVSLLLYGSHRSDDLLYPYPVSEEFSPQRTAFLLLKQYRDGWDQNVFIDFDSDPPSLKFPLMNNEFPEFKILYDRPDLGKVVYLSGLDTIVCGSGKRLEEIKERFSLRGEYVELDTGSSMQKIFVPKILR